MFIAQERQSSEYNHIIYVMVLLLFVTEATAGQFSFAVCALYGINSWDTLFEFCEED
jgi:hypothetical protein